MDLIRKIGGNKSEIKQKFKEREQEVKIEKMIEERQKSSNKRELEKYMHEQDEKRIKEALDKIHKTQNKENWKGQSILKSDKNILTNDSPILKEKNIFKGHKASVLNSGSLNYFKW